MKTTYENWKRLHRNIVTFPSRTHVSIKVYKIKACNLAQEQVWNGEKKKKRALVPGNNKLFIINNAK